jgi:hypothetical protein
MTRMPIVFVPACLLLLGSAGTASAQDEPAAGPPARPVETYTCKYNEGKSRADLNKVIAEWNAWMDKQGAKDYFAVVITPFYSGDFEFDVGWLGVWPDGNAMGKGHDLWVSKGGDVAAKFSAVVNCGSHSNFVSLNVKQPPKTDPSDDDAVVTFSNCSIKDGKTFDDLMAAQQAWNTYADANGFTGGAWVMFPLFGETDNDYDFKYVESSPDFPTFGADYQRMSDGAWQKGEELFGPVLKCDHGRVYTAHVVRRYEMAEN